ncbi:MAG TPA: DnrO protein [Luteimonas sp.]|nr:DnrO protein [Luteimonas sp.]
MIRIMETPGCIAQHALVTSRPLNTFRRCPMKPTQLPLALALALAIGAVATGCAQDAPSAPAAPAAEADATAQHADTDAHADEHDVDHAHAATETLGVDFAIPANHVRWQPDAPLIEGMSRVRTAIAGLQHAGPAQHPDAATVTARTADVDAAIEYMFANCSLDTEPDIALHAILARLMAGTQALNGNPADTSPVADMAAAVDNYEQLFDDPDSSAAPAPH